MGLTQGSGAFFVSGLVLVLLAGAFVIQKVLTSFSHLVGWLPLLGILLVLVVIASSFIGGSRVALASVALAFVLFVVVLASAATGPVSIDYLTVAKILLDSLPLISFKAPRKYEIIVMRIRMPRIAVGGIVGFALASAGAVMQGFFRNPMADPSIIGVSSGAAVGAVATIVLPIALPFGFSSLSTAAFVGAVLAAFGVYLLATQDGRTPVATLLLAGIAVQTFLGAVVSFLLVQSGENLREAILWLMGRLINRSWSHVEISLPTIFLGFFVLLGYSRDLNILLLGEEEAHGLGVEVERSKRVLLAVSSVVTGVAVAVSGVIGFVGLIVPHAMRLIVGPDHRILLPTSALAGASFLIVADTLARTVLGAGELPVGIVTAFVGAPFFLYLLRKREVYSL